MRTRKRSRNPAQWKPIKRKKLKDSGKSYITCSGKVVDPKYVKPCECKCGRQCKTFTENNRQEVFDNFWKLHSYEEKQHYLNEHTEVSECQSHRVHYRRVRSKTVIYTLPKDDCNIPVCKNFFLATLDLKKGQVNYFMQNKKETKQMRDGRGRSKKNRRKVSDELLQDVKAHIESFPTVDPHYVRKSSTRKYLSSHLSITKMYELYLQQKKANDKGFVKRSYYRKVFNTEYNLSFHQPKKDACITCDRFKLKCMKTEKDVADHKSHIELKDKAQQEKEADKVKSIECKDKSFQSFSFDLQSVLYTPCSDVSSMYYSRKLSVYNFTVYNQGTKEGKCYMWDESHGNRGANEIGTCLFKHMCSLPSYVSHVSMFCDSCCGQNRNKYIALALLHMIKQSNLNIIDMKYLVSGHTHMEVDSIHSAIESAKKNARIYIPEDWYNIIRMARRARPYLIVPLSFESFLDFKQNTQQVDNTKFDEEGKPVKWLNIRWIRATRWNPNTILFKYNFESEFKALNLKRQKKGRNAPAAHSEALVDLVPAYNARLPISSKKKHDLLNLCSQGVVPCRYKAFYEGLPESKEKFDRLPEPDQEELEKE